MESLGHLLDAPERDEDVEGRDARAEKNRVEE
jgi:hypothetical protein